MSALASAVEPSVVSPVLGPLLTWRTTLTTEREQFADRVGRRLPQAFLTGPAELAAPGFVAAGHEVRRLLL